MTAKSTSLIKRPPNKDQILHIAIVLKGDIVQLDKKNNSTTYLI